VGYDEVMVNLLRGDQASPKDLSCNNASKWSRYFGVSFDHLKKGYMSKGRRINHNAATQSETGTRENLPTSVEVA
jgi:hypothetical protein